MAIFSSNISMTPLTRVLSCLMNEEESAITGVLLLGQRTISIFRLFLLKLQSNVMQWNVQNNCVLSNDW